jgi:hypothetical protein
MDISVPQIKAVGDMPMDSQDLPRTEIDLTVDSKQDPCLKPSFINDQKYLLIQSLRSPSLKRTSAERWGEAYAKNLRMTSDRYSRKKRAQAKREANCVRRLKFDLDICQRSLSRLREQMGISVDAIQRVCNELCKLSIKDKEDYISSDSSDDDIYNQM